MITYSKRYVQLQRQLAKLKAIKKRTRTLMREMKLRDTNLTASMDAEIEITACLKPNSYIQRSKGERTTALGRCVAQRISGLSSAGENHKSLFALAESGRHTFRSGEGANIPP